VRDCVLTNDDFKGFDGFHTFQDDAWPKVLPFLVHQYNCVPSDKGTKGRQFDIVQADFVHSRACRRM
jgi:hypothetical protein